MRGLGLVTNGTFVPPTPALQFAHDHYGAEKVPLPAVRDDRRPVRLWTILLPLPIAHRSPPLRRQPVLLQAVPGGVWL